MSDLKKKATKQALEAARQAREDIGADALAQAKAILENESKQKRMKSADEVAAEILAAIETRH